MSYARKGARDSPLSHCGKMRFGIQGVFVSSPTVSKKSDRIRTSEVALPAGVSKSRSLCGEIELSLKDHLIICGLGHVGYRIAELLFQMGEPFVVIVRELRHDWKENIYLWADRVIMGDARSVGCLKAAQPETARAVLVVTGSDLVNIEIIMDLEILSPETPIIARIFDPFLVERTRYSKKVRSVLSPALLAAPVFVAAAVGPEILQTFDINGHRLDLAQLRFTPENADAAGTFDSFCARWQLIPIAIDHAEAPMNDLMTKAQPGDILSFIAKETTLEQLRHEGWLPKIERSDYRANLRKRFQNGLLHPGAQLRRIYAGWKNVPEILRRAFGALFGLFVFSVFLFHQFLPGSPSWLDSVYFVVTIMATVGFGDFNLRESVWWLKLYGCGLMISGVILVAIFSGMVLDYLVSLRVDTALGRKPSGLQDHIVVVGLGDVGKRVAEELTRLNEPVVAIQKNVEDENLSKILDKMTVIIGDAQRESLLRLANIEHARALIVATSSDLESIRIANLAESVNPDIRCVIRINDSELAQKLAMRMKINRTVNAASISAVRFVCSALREGVEQSFLFQGKVYALRWLSQEERRRISTIHRDELRRNCIYELRHWHDDSDRLFRPAEKKGVPPEIHEGLLILEVYDKPTHSWKPATM